jgi:Zn-dependent protease
VGFITFDGNFKFSIKGNNFCNFKTDNQNKALVILLSGPLVNFVFLAISIVLLIINKDLMKFFFILTFVFNLVSIFFDLCPVTENDGKAILKIIKEKTKEVRKNEKKCIIICIN